ncbi:MAG: class D sortase [Anaerolineae bacterium]|jgi:sortase A|nr:class D sortase [Anaerolineae bacterium]
MKDRRPVDELSIEELEEILRLKKREARLERLRARQGEAVDSEAPASSAALSPAPVVSPPASGRYSVVLEEPARGRGERRSIQWRWVTDKLLLMVEVLAILGLVLVATQMLSTIRTLNAESQEQQAAPTPTPTPVISVAVLPGGHTPPDVRGESQPLAIPIHLQKLVAEITPLPPPTPGPEHAQRIVITTIGVDAPVVEGDDWEALKKGVGHHIGSVNPGERGNCIISAHNDIYGEIFRNLPELRVGDEILVHTVSQVYRYVVRQTRIIEPTDVSVMMPTNTPVLTLISCYPYRVDTQRIVVIASLE